MKIAYLILAHKNPFQLLLLINSLRDGKSHFFIHIDKKSSDDFTFINGNDITFCENRYDIKWGGFNMVKATIGLMNEASNSDFDYFILLSGMDFSIKSKGLIQQFLKDSKGKSYLSYYHVPTAQWIDNKYRYEKYFFNFKNRFLRSLFNRLSQKLPYKRKFYNGMQPYIGSQWWILHRDHFKYVLDYLKENPGLYGFFKYTFVPDEMVFQSVLLNSVYRNDIVNKDPRFLKWTNQSASPLVFTMQNYKEILYSDALFARKFDVAIDEEIVHRIKEHISE